MKCFRDARSQVQKGNTPFVKVGIVLTLYLPHSDAKEQADLDSMQVVMLYIFINIRQSPGPNKLNYILENDNKIVVDYDIC